MSGTGLSEEDTVWVRDAIDSFTRCLESGDYDAWAAYWTEDGILMPPDHGRVTGRDNLIAYARDDFGAVDTVNLSDFAIEGSGNLAVATSNVAVYWEAPVGKEPHTNYKQMIELRKSPEGRWQIKTVIFNTDSS